MDVILCWHMHQPDYRLGGVYTRPWTFLHAIKDYTDMAAHLESIPGARAAVNFSPVLIQQLQDYPLRIRALSQRGKPSGDRVLDALGGIEDGDRAVLLEQLLRAHEQRMKGRFPHYAQLAGQARSAISGQGHFGWEAVRDLSVWYVLVWLGESLRGLPLVQALARRAGAFTDEERRALLELVADVMEGIVPRYRKLADRGIVELSLTPYAHPILPLLLDFESARESMPDAELPDGNYPGGQARCNWHVAEARQVFTSVFGFEPQGCWPAEGALSQATLPLLAQQGFRWTASGSQVLRNSLRRAGEAHGILPQLSVWQPPGGPACYFRDDGLSDLIGFEYSKWPADKAVDDFLRRLDSLREDCQRSGNGTPVLSIIMDGENAWEYYPQNGWSFLQTLYTRLVAHPHMNLTTFSEVLENTPARPLPELCAGSWVHGSLSTWIGDAAKNRAWEQLITAKRAVDRALDSGFDEQDPKWVYAVLRQLAICEASDWFWWPGEGERLEHAPEFEALFRRNLEALYRLLEVEPPEDIAGVQPESVDESLPQAPDVTGAMRRSV